jgi:hypothetical protein
MNKKSGFIEEIDSVLHLLKRHLPYHESDHVLNIAYNAIAGGTRLEDIELQRQNKAWLDALGAEIIPDPTTEGDFLRRFNESDIIELMEATNKTRMKVWKKQPKKFRVLSASLRKRKKSEFSCIFFARGGCLVCGVYHPRFKMDY